ncbi:MAG: hypothetical protein LBL49_04555 [Clostridiales Family XIII bacterium]|nr:hypothetical protein [Clostridiales Family XIII bacterium]
MSLENVAKKISRETSKSRDMSEQMAQKLAAVHESLRPVVSAWLHDERAGFEYDGISLDDIMAKENSAYIQAVLTMDLLLKNPDFIADYKAMGFDADYIGG